MPLHIKRHFRKMADETSRHFEFRSSEWLKAEKDAARQHSTGCESCIIKACTIIIFWHKISTLLALSSASLLIKLNTFNIAKCGNRDKSIALHVVDWVQSTLFVSHISIFHCVGLDWRPEYVNSLGPCDAIWRHISLSTPTQVMACCRMAPSHYLNQCWLVGFCCINIKTVSQEILMISINKFENYNLESTAASPGMS